MMLQGRRLMILWLCLCLTISMSVAGIAKADLSGTGSPAILNPGFEETSSDGSIPGWSQLLGMGASGSIALDTAVVHQDRYSLKIDDQDSVNFAAESSKFPVYPDKTYTVTSSVYLAGGSVQLQLRFYDSASKLVTGGIAVHDPNYTSQPTKVWQDISVSAAPPVNASYASVVILSGKTVKGVSYWDDIIVKETDPKPPAPPARRILANAGFEAPVTDSGIPGWKVTTGKASVKQSEVFEGNNSLFVENTAGTGAGIRVDSDLIDVEEGAAYLLSANVFLQLGSMQGFYVYVYDETGGLVKSADGKDFHAYLNVLNPVGDWTYAEVPFTVQPGGKKVKLSLISGNRRSFEYYIDDVSILKAVKNGSFEQESPVNNGIPGWKKYNDATDGSTFGISQDKAADGTKSLMLKSDPGKYINVISDLIDVEPGAVYTASAKTYIESGSSGMYVRYFDRTGKYVGQQEWSIASQPVESWFTSYVKATVPAGATKAGIMFAGSATKTFTYYVDSVKLQKGDHAVAVDPIPENSIVRVGQDLGPQIRKATIMRGDYGKDGDGRDVLYTVVAGAPSVFTVIDVATEQVVKSMPMNDTSGAWSVKVSSDGTVYLGAYNLGLLYRYFPNTGELKNLGHPLPTKDSVLYPMDSGPDGKMYGGNYPTGSLYMYDPATNRFTDYGTMSYNSSGERWNRVTVYDAKTHKAYVGMGNTPRLVEYDFATGVKRDLLPAKYNNIIAVYDLNLVDGKLFARKEANKASEMFILDALSGEQLEVTNASTGEKLYDIPNFSRGVSPKSPVDDKVYYAAAGGQLYAYDLSDNTIRDLGVSIEGAAIGYGFVQLHEDGFPGYSLVGLSGNSGKMFKYNLETGKVKLTQVMLPAEPVNIHDIEKGPDGRIYTTGYLAGNIGVYTPSTGKSVYLDGISQGEGTTFIGNNMYVGVYPDAKIYEYDLSKPWNRDNPDKLNPVLLSSLKENASIPGYTLQDRPFGMAGSEELGKLFVGTVPKNSLLGGAFAVYDIHTKEAPKVYWNLVPEQSILSLVYKDGKVYGGTSIHGGQGGTPKAKDAVLFVWDAVKGEKVFETVPVAGKQAITALHVGPDGNIWGLANGAVFIFDPIQQSVIYSKDEFPDAAGRWIDGSMETGTDGNLYATVGGRFFKLDAATKEVTLLATQARKVAQDDYGNFYLYSNPEGTNLYKYTIPELLVKLTGAELSMDDDTPTVGESIPLKVKGLLEKGRSTYDLGRASIVYTVSRPQAAAVVDGRLVLTRPGQVEVKATVMLDGAVAETNTLRLIVRPEQAQGPKQ